MDCVANSGLKFLEENEFEEQRRQTDVDTFQSPRVEVHYLGVVRKPNAYRVFNAEHINLRLSAFEVRSSCMANLCRQKMIEILRNH
jgi:hypothetical protein